MSTVNKIIVFDETLELNSDMEVSEVRANLGSLIRDLNPDLAQIFSETDYEIHEEDGTLVVYRKDVNFG